MRLRTVTVCVCALLGALLMASPAGADVFGPISLVSQGALGGAEPQQAEYAHDTAISADGRYVVFDGSIGGVRGVWRRDLQSGALQQVAGGNAELPSVSEHGQYVSFTTNEGASLPEVTYSLAGKRPSLLVGPREAVSVYVRDMTREPGEPGAFILASAANGPGQPAQPLTYQTSEPEKYGSVAAGRSAISADGRQVAFVTTAVSDLAGPDTPALQVAVRDLETNETKLVSRCLKCEAGIEPAVGSVESGQAYGAVYPGALDEFLPVPPYGAYGPSPPPGASISADGTTVTWIGENVEQQAPMLSAEKRSAHYTEPLWRRIEPPETGTERVTGGSDPDNPACIESGETALPASPAPTDPCQGPFYVEEQQRLAGILNETGGSGEGEFVPRLSADGYTVLFTSEAPMVSLGENFGRTRSGQPSDLYIADMHPGLTRDEALRPITELAGGEGASLAGTAPIFDFEIAAGGGQLAFSTRRTQFILGTPALVSPPAGEPGLDELFDVDLTDDTLTRVTHGYGGLGEPAEHPHTPRAAGEEPYEEPGDGVLSPSLSADGSILAFSSTASNLVYGDANAPPSEEVGPLDGSDAFVVGRVLFSPLPTPQYISPSPQVSTDPAWILGVTALARPDGSVVLYVTTPGAGMAQASAQSAVLTRFGKAARSARRSARDKRAGRTRRGAAVVRLETRTVAYASRNAGGPSQAPVALVLKLGKAYTALASATDGLSAKVSVVFKAPDEPALRQSLVVSFKRAASSSRRRSDKTTPRLKHASSR